RGRMYVDISLVCFSRIGVAQPTHAHIEFSVKLIERSEEEKVALHKMAVRRIRVCRAPISHLFPSRDATPQEDPTAFAMPSGNGFKNTLRHRPHLKHCGLSRIPKGLLVLWQRTRQTSKLSQRN